MNAGALALRPLFGMTSPAGAAGRLSILIFHRVLPEPDPLFPDEPDIKRFTQMMKCVATWFNVLPLGDAVARLAEGTLPARAAAITFDDGYADNLLCAAPVLKRLGLHATFFVASGFLDGGRMWNDTVIESVRLTRKTSIEGLLPDLPPLPLGSVRERRAALDRIILALKHLPSAERADKVEQVAGYCVADLPADLMMSSDQLRSLHGMGMGIGAHTINHPILARSTVDAAWHEIEDGRRQLEEILRSDVTLFAYPNGKAVSDYLPEHVRMTRELGFKAAVTTNWGTNVQAADPFQLARFTPWDKSMLRFGLRMLRYQYKVAPECV